MIYSNGLCDLCQRYHAPDWDFKEGCPEQRRDFFSRESERLYHQRQELELKNAIQARESQKAAEEHALRWGKASAILKEVLEEERQAKFAAAREACAQGLAALHEYREAQEAARRVLRNQRVRERERQGEGRP
jgi:hypothetical protein